MPKKILVVDDESYIVRLIRVNLENAGYEVVTADSGKDALEKVEAEIPDLVVLDESMPYMDGHKVLENLRTNPAAHKLPVIMLMIARADADGFPYPNMGVEGLRKPFDPKKLMSYVERMLADQEGSKANWNEAFWRNKVQTAIPTPAPAAPTQPVSWWRKIRRLFD